MSLFFILHGWILSGYLSSSLFFLLCIISILYFIHSFPYWRTFMLCYYRQCCNKPPCIQASSGQVESLSRVYKPRGKMAGAMRGVYFKFHWLPAILLSKVAIPNYTLGSSDKGTMFLNFLATLYIVRLLNFFCQSDGWNMLSLFCLFVFIEIMVDSLLAEKSNTKRSIYPLPNVPQW